MLEVFSKIILANPQHRWNFKQQNCMVSSSFQSNAKANVKLVLGVYSSFPPSQIWVNVVVWVISENYTIFFVYLE